MIALAPVFDALIEEFVKRGCVLLSKEVWRYGVMYSLCVPRTL